MHNSLLGLICGIYLWMSFCTKSAKHDLDLQLLKKITFDCKERIMNLEFLFINFLF